MPEASETSKTTEPEFSSSVANFPLLHKNLRRTLFVDAFSGDSIPIHLLTREAFALYFKHLKPGGVLAIHITNLHLDLSDPVRNLATEFGRTAFLVDHNPDETENHSYYSSWVLITKDIDFIAALRGSDFLSKWHRETPKKIHWTDDYSNLFEVTF